MSGADEKKNGQSMYSVKLDWSTQTMTLAEVSPDLRSICKIPDETTYPFSPLVLFLEKMTQHSGSSAEEGEPARFLIDCLYDRQNVTLRLHVSNKYASVLNVPQELLHAVLRDALTPRESEIAAMLFQGDTIRCIAGRLHIAEGTVKRTIYNIYQKLQINSQGELIRAIYALLA